MEGEVSCERIGGDVGAAARRKVATGGRAWCM